MNHVCWCEKTGEPRGSTHMPCPEIIHGSPRKCVSCGQEFGYEYVMAGGGYKQTSECQSVRYKVAYIAGPYRAGHGRTVLQNIRAAEEVAIRYWKMGYAVICPHMNTAFFDGLCDDNVWLDGDLELVRRSDVVVMMKDWKESLGARKEMELAKRLGKEILWD